jgi:hypothetical protein
MFYGLLIRNIWIFKNNVALRMRKRAVVTKIIQFLLPTTATTWNTVLVIVCIRSVVEDYSLGNMKMLFLHWTGSGSRKLLRCHTHSHTHSHTHIHSHTKQTLTHTHTSTHAHSTHTHSLTHTHSQTQNTHFHTHTCKLYRYMCVCIKTSKLYHSQRLYKFY